MSPGPRIAHGHPLTSSPEYGGGRPGTRFPAGRVCATEGCGAILSTYNGGKHCQPCVDNGRVGGPRSGERVCARAGCENPVVGHGSKRYCSDRCQRDRAKAQGTTERTTPTTPEAKVPAPAANTDGQNSGPVLSPALAQVLGILRRNPDRYVSAETIADVIGDGTTRKAVGCRIAELRQRGIEIEGRTHAGYRLGSEYTHPAAQPQAASQESVPPAPASPREDPPAADLTAQDGPPPFAGVDVEAQLREFPGVLDVAVSPDEEVIAIADIVHALEALTSPQRGRVLAYVCDRYQTDSQED